MAIGSDLVSSLTGLTDKACLVVHDVRANGEALELKQQQLGKLSSLSALQQKQSEFISHTLSKLENSSDFAANRAGAMGTDKVFYVQFNPSSLQMYSTNISEKVHNTCSDGKQQITSNDTVTAPRIELTTTLVFDKMNIYDAFMFDKMTTGVSATTATNLVTMATGSVFTVQPYVEGLISALRNPYTRSMTFQWADFSFTGRLSQLQATYKMFSVSGRPIRAEVQMRLCQDLDSTDRQRWKNQFETMLTQKHTLASAGQKVSNLLNLSL